MLTVDNLRKCGVNPDEGIARCLQNETFYLTLVGKALDDDGIERLKTAVEQGNLGEAFEIAHALKGVFGNLSLTPLYDGIVEITELLRNRESVDYSPYLQKVSEVFAQLKTMHQA